MEVGASNNRFLVVIQARMNSSRLPGKVLLKVSQESSIIEVLLRRVKSLGWPVIVATSTSSKDDILCDVINNEGGVEIYRGSEDDVFSRYLNIAKNWREFHIVRLTADNPLLDVDLLDYVAREVYKPGISSYFSLGRSRRMPSGLTFEIFSSHLLFEAANLLLTEKEREHVTPVFYNGKMNNVDIQNFHLQENFSDLSFTIDTQEDLAFIRKLIRDYDGLNLGWKELCLVVLRNNLGYHRSQKSWSE